MNAEVRSPEFAIRRILAAFSPSSASRAAIEGAVELAARLGAELEALFVEDVNLLRLAELPFIREATVHGPGGRPLHGVELELRAQAEQIRHLLTQAAARRQLRCEFRTTRGHLTAEIGAAAEHVDLVVLECISRPIARELRLEPPARALIRQVTRSVLLLPPGGPPAGPVHVLLEETEAARRTLRAAGELARRYGSSLIVTAAAESRLQEWRELLAALPVPAEIRTLGAAGRDEVEPLLRAVARGTLVLDLASRLIEAEPSWERIAKAPCTVLLVR